MHGRIGGRWLLRIEDMDRPREVAGSADGILRTSQAFGFEWDGEIVRQRSGSMHYAAGAASLQARGLTFECSCSRLQLEEESRYPGTCRVRPRSPGCADGDSSARRAGTCLISDRIQGDYRQDVAAAVGDIILKRRDQVFAYVLAVVVDDAAQGVTHIVRGADLLDNTPRQIYLQRQLGLPLPLYAHVPVLTEPDDTKLAKSRRSVRLDAGNALPQLLTVFSMLGLRPPRRWQVRTIAEAWDWAIAQWDIKHESPKRRERAARNGKLTGQKITIKCRFALALHCAILDRPSLKDWSSRGQARTGIFRQRVGQHERGAL